MKLVVSKRNPLRATLITTIAGVTTAAQAPNILAKITHARYCLVTYPFYWKYEALQVAPRSRVLLPRWL
ncbi:MAG: hypothetical protein ACI9U1_002030 [Porticoccaceae bacterium]|jgi:hypothetical protein